MFWSRTKLDVVVSQSADLADPGATTNTDVPGLTVELPRAGLYHINAMLPYTAAATSKTMGVGVVFSGSATSVDAWAIIDQPGGVIQGAQQSVVGTLGTATGRTSTAGRIQFLGVIKVPTAGTLKMQISRSAGTVVFVSGIMVVREG